MRSLWQLISSSLAALVIGAALCPPAGAQLCRDITPDGRLSILSGPRADGADRPCNTLMVAPTTQQRFRTVAPTMRFTTGEIGPFTTGEIGPFTTFSNSPTAPRRR